MDIQYRNNYFKIIPEEEEVQNFSGYKHHIENGTLKIREKYIAGHIFAVHYYTNSNDNKNQIAEHFKNLSDLQVFSIRTRYAYGEFWIDEIQYFDFEKDRFSNLAVRELYNSKEQLIAWECTDPSLSSDNEYYYQLSKSIIIQKKEGVVDALFLITIQVFFLTLNISSKALKQMIKTWRGALKELMQSF